MVNLNTLNNLFVQFSDFLGEKFEKLQNDVKRR